MKFNIVLLMPPEIAPSETIRLMREIDAVIEKVGGWLLH